MLVPSHKDKLTHISNEILAIHGYNYVRRFKMKRESIPFLPTAKHGRYHLDLLEIQ
jgi:hypothetical protein